jgi:predicted transcriptional regulator of viral defense system
MVGEFFYRKLVFYLRKVLFLTSKSDKLYIEFKNKFAKLPLISLLEIQKGFPNLDKRRLFEWTKKGYIENVKRGFYRFTDQSKSQELLYFTANKIYSPSYISLETALAYYQVIPEEVFSTTSISTLNTTQITSSLGYFSYRNLKKPLLFGYKFIQLNGLTICMASLEKAILDYLYLHSQLNTVDDFEALRWDKEALKQLDIELFFDYLHLFNSKTLTKRTQILKKYIHD